MASRCGRTATASTVVVSGATRRLSRPAQLPPPRLEAGPARRWDRADAAVVRPAPHVRDLCAQGWHLRLRPLPLHGRQPGDDRPPLRPPRPRRARARGPHSSTRLRPRTPPPPRGRSVDVAADTATRLAKRDLTPGTGSRDRAVDVWWTSRRSAVAEMANRTSPSAGTSAEPSDGLEPSTPSL
jgi:hypothetical protein